MIHGVKFAERADTLTGKIALRSLTRLADLLASPNGELRYELRGFVRADGRPSLHGIIDGEVELICQRCLGVMRFPVHVDRSFLLVADEAELPDPLEEDDSVDVLVAAPLLDTTALIEDEVILSLPMAPRHDGECGPARHTSESGGRENPFSKLKSLKKH